MKIFLYIYLGNIIYKLLYRYRELDLKYDNDINISQTICDFFGIQLACL